MSVVGRNVVANLVGRAWTGMLGIIFPPLFADFLGIEAYGLVGLYATLTALLVVVDLGLARTVQRELAVLGLSAEEQRHARDLVRTFEVLFWTLGIAFAGAIWVAAPALAHTWIHVNQMNVFTAVSAIRLMGLAAAVNWSVQMYAQVLLGLQHQVLTSALSTLASTVRVVGVALVLWKGPRTVTAFFAWTLFVTVGWLVVVRIGVERRFPGGLNGAQFRFGIVRRHMRSSVSLWIASASAVALTQIDRVVASKVLSLQEFGYFALAVAAASAMQLVVLPIWNAVFPRLCQLAADQSGDLTRFYRLATQMLSVILCPAAVVLIVFGYDVLLAWTGNEEIAQAGRLILAGLAVSAATNGLMNLPYALQVAHGGTRVAMRVNVGALLVAMPLVTAGGRIYGGAGAAWMSAVVGLLSLAASVALTHRRYLGDGPIKWMNESVFAPGAAAMIAALALRGAYGSATHRGEAASLVVSAGVLTFAASLLAATTLRNALTVRLVRVFRRVAL